MSDSYPIQNKGSYQSEVLLNADDISMTLTVSDYERTLYVCRVRE